MSAPGIRFNTFTIVGRCTRTGAIGICLASAPLTVGSRCPYVRAKVGAVSTQAFTNPVLGPQALDLLQGGAKPAEIIDTLGREDVWFEYRQIGIVAIDGAAAAHTGPLAEGWAGHIAAPNFVAMGNKLVGGQVIEAIAQSFRDSTAEALLEERLMGAIEAGRAAGGQAAGHLSGALIVCGEESHPRTDLRIEMAKPTPEEGGDAVDDLRRVFDAFKPLIPYYQAWPKDPRMPNWRDWLKRKRAKR